MALLRMVLVMGFTVLFTAHRMGCSGEIAEFLSAVLGHQLNDVLSSCCMIREVRCSRSLLTSSTSSSDSNASTGLALQLQRFGRCVCSSRQRCSFSFPPSFLPEAVNDVGYNVTFITVSTTSKYKCTYRGTRALDCDRVQTISTAMVSIAAPAVVGGPRGALAALGSAGLWGEAMEEALETISEAGAFHHSHPANWLAPGRGRCRASCESLRCVTSVVEERSRNPGFIEEIRSPNNPPTERQGYHQCLRMNYIQPPHFPTTTMRSDAAELPENPIRNAPGLYPHPSSKKTTPAFSSSSSSSSSTTTTTTTTTTTARTTTMTNVIPTVSTMLKSTPIPPTSVIPSISTTSISVPENQTTSEARGRIAGSSPVGMVEKSMMTDPNGDSSATEEDITRMLVGPGTTTSHPPPKDYQAVEDGDDPNAAKSGVKSPGVVAIGVASAVGVLGTCLVCFYLVRRRRQKRKEELDSSGLCQGDGQISTVTVGHYKTRPLPHVSFKKVFTKSGGNSDDAKKADSGGQSTREQKATSMAQRYTTPGFMVASSKPSLQSASSSADDNEDLYASLDETSMIPSHQPLPVVSKHVTSVSIQNGVPRSSKNGKPNTFQQNHSPEAYMTMDEVAVNDTDDSTQPSRQSSSKYYNVSSKYEVPSSKSSRHKDCPVGASCSSNRASYVNVSFSDSANVYEQPGQSQPEHHEYSRLSNGRVAGQGGGDVDQDGYLVPVTPPKKAQK